MIAPSGIFWIAIPIAKTIASINAIPVFPDKNPAKQTPTAIPSGILCKVIENNNIFIFLPSAFLSIFVATIFIKIKNNTPNAKPTVAGK